MNIEKLIERHDALVAEISTAFGKRAPDAAASTRPLALHEAQAERVRSRIEALQQARKDQAAEIDAEIKALQGELKSLDKRLAADREMLAPVLEASGEKAATGRARSAKPR